MLEYQCPDCGEELRGSFGDDVCCNKCDKTFSTDYDYVDDGIACWITAEIKK